MWSRLVWRKPTPNLARVKYVNLYQTQQPLAQPTHCHPYIKDVPLLYRLALFHFFLRWSMLYSVKWPSPFMRYITIVLLVNHCRVLFGRRPPRVLEGPAKFFGHLTIDKVKIQARGEKVIFFY